MSEIQFFIQPEQLADLYSKAGDDRPNPRWRKYLKEKKLLGGELHFFAAERVFCSLTAHLVTIHGQPYAHEHKEVMYYLANESYTRFSKTTPTFTQGWKLINEDFSLGELLTKYCHSYGEDQPITNIKDAHYIGKVDKNYQKIQLNEIYRDTRHKPLERSEEHRKQLAFHDRVYHSIPHAPGMNFDEGKNMMSKFDIHEVKSEFCLVPFYLTKLEKSPPVWMDGWKSSDVFYTNSGNWEEEGFLDKGIKSLKGIKDFE